MVTEEGKPLGFEVSSKEQLNAPTAQLANMIPQSWIISSEGSLGQNDNCHCNRSRKGVDHNA